MILTRSAGSKRLDATLLAILVVGAFVLRLHDLARESFWLDEAARAAIVMLPVDQIAHGVAVVELSPPLYHVVAHAWTGLVGGGDFEIRLLSVWLGTLVVVAAWSIGSMVGGRWAAVAVAGQAAFHPLAVQYSREAAMYALLLLLSTLILRAAMGVLARDEVAPAATVRARRSRWLVAYVVVGALALYTHYYAALLLLSVCVAAVAHSLSRRAWHGVVLWTAAHLVIALAFTPWVPTALGQAQLAISVEDWPFVGWDEALTRSAQAVTFGASEPAVWPIVLAALLVPLGMGLWRLRGDRATIGLAISILAIPLVSATLLSQTMSAFRERGFLIAVPVIWLLVAMAIVGGRSTRFGLVFRGGLLIALVGTDIVGLVSHYSQSKEDWRGAVALVETQAASSEPIFFIHFAGELAFERYSHGTGQRVGLPTSFGWEHGLHAEYFVTPRDVSERVPTSLQGASQAWAVLSHDKGRGSDQLLAVLDKRGERFVDQQLYGVRVLGYRIHN